MGEERGENKLYVTTRTKYFILLSSKRLLWLAMEKAITRFCPEYHACL